MDSSKEFPLQTARDIDLDETPFAVSNTPGWLHGWFIGNAAAAIRYVKFYDALAADVVLGTTEPKLTFLIPAGATGAAANFISEKGTRFSTAISAVAVTGVADSDTTGAGANEVVANIFFTNHARNI